MMHFLRFLGVILAEAVFLILTGIVLGLWAVWDGAVFVWWEGKDLIAQAWRDTA